MKIQIDLKNFVNTLEKEGFDISVKDNVLTGSIERPTFSLEITVDSGGQMLFKKKLRETFKSQDLVTSFQTSKVLSFRDTVYQVRLIVKSTEQFNEVLQRVVDFK